MAKVLTSKDMALPDKKPEAKKAQEKPKAKPRERIVFQVRCGFVPQEGKSKIAYAGPDGKPRELPLKDGVFRFPSKMPLNAARDLLRELVAAGLTDESKSVPDGKGSQEKAAEKPKEGKDQAGSAGVEVGDLPPVFELVHPDDTRANPVSGKYVVKVGKKKVHLEVVDGRVETNDPDVADALIEAGFRPTWAPDSAQDSEEASE